MNQGDVLLVGAGQADITPAMGIQIAGDIGRPRPTEEIRDRLHARVLAIGNGKRTLCVISCDLLAITRPHADVIRRRVAEMLGTEPAAVMCHATQTHSAPMVGNILLSDDYPVPAGMDWLRGGDDRYIEPFTNAVLGAARQARAAMRPAALKAARGIDGRCAFPRRYILRDGTHVSHPAPCQADLLRPESFADPEVGVTVFHPMTPEGTADDKKAVGVLLHHTCHPVFGYGFRWVSADWPGLWAQSIRGHFGGEAVCPVLNGFCGNINPYNVLEPRHLTNMYLMADRLKETTLRILPEAAPLKAAPVKWISRKLRIPMRPISDEAVAGARNLLADHPEPIWTKPLRPQIQWDWVFAHAILDMARRQRNNLEYEYEIQVFRIGDLAIVGCPGEPFVDAQLEIKCQSPARQTMVAHLCNDWHTYIPTRQACRAGSYEAGLITCKLEEGALETIAVEAKAVLKELWQQDGAVTN
ncbi:MAG: hypothetical protein PHW60_11885 [Kiritimatiellae bacterium]|nr:hypothetical protein [Kiritimatiellia bacterium]